MRRSPGAPEGKCCRCKQVLPLLPEYFRRRPDVKRGFEYFCKRCSKKRDKVMQKSKKNHQVADYLSVRLPKGTLKQLDAAAKMREMTRSEFVRDCLMRLIEEGGEDG